MSQRLPADEIHLFSMATTAEPRQWFFVQALVDKERNLMLANITDSLFLRGPVTGDLEAMTPSRSNFHRD